MTLYLQGFIFCLLALLAACSGGGGSSEAEVRVSSCIVSPADLNEAIAGTDPSGATTYTLSGTVKIQGCIATDSDNNNRSDAYSNNSTFDLAQTVSNGVAINGFVTKVPTNNNGDQFENSTDVLDIYRITLAKNQRLLLEVADFDPDNAESNDIDLLLFSVDASRELIAESFTTSSSEQIVIDKTAEYYVVVLAYQGTSKYLLSVLDNVASVPSSPFQNLHLQQLIPNEAIVEYLPGQGIASNDRNYIAALEPEPSPMVLEKWDKPSSLATISSKKSSLISSMSAFEASLLASNPNSYEKFKTLERIKQLNLSGMTKYASPNFMRETKLLPNDPLYSTQWHYDAINLPQAWDISTGSPSSGNDIWVAVVDTGIVLDHEDLRDKLVDGYDFILSNTNSGDGEDGIDNNPDDPGDLGILDEETNTRTSTWHGSHVAGTVAASSNNNIGVAGVSWGAKIMPLRVCGRQGCSLYDTLQAVRYAARLPNDSQTLPSRAADIINLSLGGFGYSSAAADLYHQVVEKGIIVVAAAGNESSSIPAYPASYPGVISVSALDSVSSITSYSNIGANIDIAAPGGNSGDLDGNGLIDGVRSTTANDDDRSSEYTYKGGTSMASPHVAGMFALMKAVYPALTPSDVDALLQAGSLTVDIGESGRDDLYGYGRADAYAAVSAAQDLALGGEIPPVISVSPYELDLGQSNNSATISLSSIGGGTPILTDFSVNKGWLSVASGSIDAQNLGTYEVTVDRTGLADGRYSAKAIFNFDTASTVNVNVSITVGTPSNQLEGETAQLYVLVVDPDTLLSVNTSVLSESNGAYEFSIPGIAAGDYVIVVGTDVDNNNIFCETAEACGVYSDADSNYIISVNNSIESLDVLVEISSASSTNDTVQNISSYIPPQSLAKKIELLIK